MHSTAVRDIYIYTSIMLQHCGRAGATQSVAMRRVAMRRAAEVV